MPILKPGERLQLNDSLPAQKSLYKGEYFGIHVIVFEDIP